MRIQAAIVGLVVSAMFTSVCFGGDVSLDWVFVGDPGNRGELSGAGADGFGEDRICGQVEYEYYIGKFEVTNGQYIDFLNAVGANDPYGLYDSRMGGAVGGISRQGGDGSYTYGAKDNDTSWLTKPVNFVSWYDCLRFANWLHNDRLVGQCDKSTTEDGAYDLSLGSGAERRDGAQYFLASEDEWYKAAYYKGGGVDSGYWDYPTMNDFAPANDPPPEFPYPAGAENMANYYDSGFAVGPPWYVTDVGSYVLSVGSYGTHDQAGNLWEWNEAVISDFYRGCRGGSWSDSQRNLHANYRGVVYAPLDYAADDIGFRLAKPVPELPALVLMVLGTAVILWRREKRCREAAYNGTITGF